MENNTRSVTAKAISPDLQQNTMSCTQNDISATGFTENGSESCDFIVSNAPCMWDTHAAKAYEGSYVLPHM